MEDMCDPYGIAKMTSAVEARLKHNSAELIRLRQLLANLKMKLDEGDENVTDELQVQVQSTTDQLETMFTRVKEGCQMVADLQSAHTKAILVCPSISSYIRTPHIRTHQGDDVSFTTVASTPGGPDKGGITAGGGDDQKETPGGPTIADLSYDIKFLFEIY